MVSEPTHSWLGILRQIRVVPSPRGKVYPFLVADVSLPITIHWSAAWIIMNGCAGHIIEHGIPRQNPGGDMARS